MVDDESFSDLILSDYPYIKKYGGMYGLDILN